MGDLRVLGTSSGGLTSTPPTSLINAVTPVTVATWLLGSSQATPPESVEPLTQVLDDRIESVIGPDDRKKVHPDDFAPGGKYRSKYNYKHL